ncbi:MAG: prefoldin subunit alpha [Hadesarchaea archaeon CG08_land_8_20_14_0_20_51_8]|nr:MAG: prefoldin subunit alpha [Hadesarchaea archaeon CG08_land_8_20_14_0_20_51_8]
MEKLSKEEQQKLQQIFNELQNYEAMADLLRQQINMIANSLTELSMTVETIKTIRELKLGTEILVPIGSDSFVTTKLATTDKIITGLGADVSAEQSVDGTKQMLEARIAELGRVLEQARQELEKIGKQIEELRPEADRILTKTKER